MHAMNPSTTSLTTTSARVTQPLHLAFGLAITLLLVVGCGQRDDDTPAPTVNTLRDRTAEAIDSAADVTAQTAADLKSKLNEQAGKLEARIESLKDQARDDSEALVQQARQKLDQVKDAMASLDDATAEQRERVHQEVVKLLADIQAWWDKSDS
jgi:methyl-accepting chemotaxis protein